MTDLADDPVESYRRSILGDRAETPASVTYDAVLADVRRESAQRQQPAASKQTTMQEFVAAEREKLRPKLQRTGIILDHAAQYGYGSEQRRR